MLRPTSRPDAVAPAAEEWATLSRDMYAAGDYQRALAPTLELTKAYPHQHIYFERLAVIYQRLNQPASEAAAWEAYVNLSPTPIEACPAMPKAYVTGGDAARARDAFERCARFEPGNADAQVALALFELRAGQLDVAERAARAVLQLDGDNADALLVAGLAAQRLGRGADARRDLSRALQVAKDYVDAHIALGILDFSEARVEDARQHFRRAADLEPARRAELDVWLKRVGEGS